MSSEVQNTLGLHRDSANKSENWCRFIRNNALWRYGPSGRVNFLARIDKALTPPRRSADPKLGRNTIVGFRFLSPSAPGVCSETGVHLFYRERQIGGQAE